MCIFAILHYDFILMTSIPLLLRLIYFGRIGVKNFQHHENNGSAIQENNSKVQFNFDPFHVLFLFWFVIIILLLL